MTNANQVFRTLEAWIARGWLSPLNRAFARFLLDQDPAAANEVLWAGALVSHQLDRGEVYLDLSGLAASPGQTLAIPSVEAWPNETAAAESEMSAICAYRLDHWQKALNGSLLVAPGEGDTPLVLDGDRLYLRRYWQYQQTMLRAIGERVQPARERLPEALLAQLPALFPPAAHNATVDWQKIACILALRSRFAIITGGPGTGKTTTLTKLLALWVQLFQLENGGVRKPGIMLAAPTGKASARVSESIGKALDELNLSGDVAQLIPKKAGTLHRLLGSRRDSRRFIHNHHHPLAADLVVVDEASMIDLEMMASLLDALPRHAQLILLGDKDQLASVEAGAVMGDLCKGAEHAAYDAGARSWMSAYAGLDLPPSPVEGSAINQQTVMLRHSHRFGAHSGIGRLAEAVNAGDHAQAQAVLNDADRYPDLFPEPSEDYRLLRSRPQPELADRLLNALIGVDSIPLRTCPADSSRVLRGSAHKDALRPELLERFSLHSRAERGNGEGELYSQTPADSKTVVQHGYGYYLRVLREERPSTPEEFDAWAEQVLNAFDTFQVLAAVRRGRWGVDALNQRIAGRLFPKTAIALWFEGRPVMVTRNDYNLGLMNGDVGIALRDFSGALRAVFPSNDPQPGEARIRWLSPMRLPDVDTAFAITVHKAQGSEFDHVVLSLPETQSPVLSRELIYTGITRAKTQFTLLESNGGVFASALGTRIKKPFSAN